MTQCALCSNTITLGVGGNDSEEHIIPNSIGGRKVISGFICQSCNSKSGNGGEAELARQLNWWSLTLGIKRQRNDPPAMYVDVVGGGRVRLRPDGSLENAVTEFQKTPIADGGYNLKLTAPDVKQAKKMIDGLKKKHPNADLESIKEKLEVIEVVNPVIEVDASFGGLAIGYSAIKSVCALASYHGLDVSEYELSAKYLRGDINEPPYNFFYVRDLVVNRPDKYLFHCVSIKSDVSRKLLLGYIEYFGFGRFVIVLSDNYVGADVSRTYAINPTEGKEIELDVNLDISDMEIIDIKLGNFDADGFNTALSYALPIALEISKNRMIEREASIAYEKTLKELGVLPGQDVTEELARKVSSRMVENIQPLISRLVRK